jgi:acetyl-CoA synthetase
MGVGEGDRVATLMGKSAELVVAMLAIWRLGAVQVPLFTAFAPAAIAARTIGNGTKVVIADAAQRAKLAPSTEIPTGAGWRIVTTGAPAAGEVSFDNLFCAAPLTTPVRVGGDGTIIELFTSGTTGAPKAVPVPLRAVAAFQMYQEYGLDQQATDVFWNAADPGWAYGLYFAIVGPLALGRTSMMLRSGFSPELTSAVLSRFGVTNFAAGPTVYRALRNAGTGVATGLRLRHCSSAGEPLGADVITWAEQTLGVPIYDQYGQTELGMAAGTAWHPDLATPLRPGTIGRPLPGWSLDVLQTDADEPAPVNERGRLAVNLSGSPLMWFTGYRDDPERTAGRFTPDGRWYLTGDLAARDEQGNLCFSSREDDVILMAGYRIGPSEVEDTLLLHDAVAEAAVVGVADELRGQVLIAYIVPRDLAGADAALITELQQLVKARYAAHAYPREIHFVPSLPRTPSGKLQRYQLRREYEERTAVS